MRRVQAALWLCALAVLWGCQSRASIDPDAGRIGDASPEAATSMGSAPARSGVRSFTHSPLSQAELPTTDGAIAIGNLGARVKGIEAQVEHRPKDGELKAGLVEVLVARGDYEGRVADYERALSLAEELVAADPKSGEARLARASARATFHLFKEAEADLAEAERLKARSDRVRSLRASILTGLGRYDEALPLLHAGREERATVQTVGSEAAVLGLMNRFDEAAKLFIEAPQYLRDASPLSLAWLYFQEALMWERAQKPARAKELYAAAVSRLPAYAHAAAHLAPTEPYAQGIAILRPITAQADDPEPLSVLADILRKKGDTSEADAALAKAKERYEELAKAHPEAYADHAAHFWLNAGGDPKKALGLAKKNLEVRKTEAAFDLVVVTALAAGAEADACAAAKEGSKLPYASELFRQTASGVLMKCP